MITITRSLLSRSTRWWLSLYADTSRAVYMVIAVLSIVIIPTEILITDQQPLQYTFLSVRPGRQGGGHREVSWSGPGTKAQGKQRQPWLHKKGQIISYSFPDLMKVMPNTEKGKLWDLATLPTAPLRSLQTDRRDRNPRPELSYVLLSHTLSYILRLIKVLSYILHLP